MGSIADLEGGRGHDYPGGAQMLRSS